MATVNPINVYYYKEIEDWANNFFSDYPKPANSDYQLIRPNRCSGELDLANIPLELKEKIISLYGKTHAVSKMLTGLVDNSYNSNNASMIEYLDKWDLLRKKNWKELFPEVAEYFK